MELSVALYLALLALVGVSRLLEVRVSSRNRRRLLARGVSAVPDPAFAPMVLLHAGVLVGAGLEVVALGRPFVPALGLPAGVSFLAATALRVWARRTLGVHWNVRIMASAPLGVVSKGPYRFVRHPNYAAVFVELCALPLIHTAWLTASASAMTHIFVLRRRIAVEEQALARDPGYRSAVGGRPRFVPDLFRFSSRARGRDRRSPNRTRSGSWRSHGGSR